MFTIRVDDELDGLCWSLSSMGERLGVDVTELLRECAPRRLAEDGEDDDDA